MKPKVMISVRTGRPESAECIQPILCSGILINLKNGLEGIDRSEKSRPTLKWCEKNGQWVSRGEAGLWLTGGSEEKQSWR